MSKEQVACPANCDDGVDWSGGEAKPCEECKGSGTIYVVTRPIDELLRQAEEVLDSYESAADALTTKELKQIRTTLAALRAHLNPVGRENSAHCKNDVCDAAKTDGVLCAENECDRANGVRPSPATSEQPVDDNIHEGLSDFDAWFMTTDHAFMSDMRSAYMKEAWDAALSRTQSPPAGGVETALSAFDRMVRNGSFPASIEPHLNTIRIALSTLPTAPLGGVVEERIKLALLTADNWPDGETFYKGTVETIREILSDAALTQPDESEVVKIAAKAISATHGNEKIIGLAVIRALMSRYNLVRKG